MSTFGPHLIGDLEGCYPGYMTNGGFIFDFMNDAVRRIGLVPIGSPHLDLYSGPHEAWEGYSATVHIQTSHITAHFFKFGYAFMDVFSCKPFDEEDFTSWVGYELVAESSYWQSVTRGFGFPRELLDG